MAQSPLEVEIHAWADDASRALGIRIPGPRTWTDSTSAAPAHELDDAHRPDIR